jgi:predicted ATP-dependent protease
LRREQFNALPEEEKQRIAEVQKELAKEAARIMRDQQEMFGELSEEVRSAERSFGASLIRPFIDKLKDRHKENSRVVQYLDRVAAYTVETLSAFRQPETGHPQGVLPSGRMLMPDHERKFTEYQVNVVIDHSEAEGAPVIVEEYPTYRNLFGNIDRLAEPGGRLVTDFTQIKSGSMLQASGGYLVFNLEDALIEPLVYKNLKRTLKSGHHRFETYDPLSLFTAGGLRPEPIPINTKVVVVGSPLLYLILRFYDDEFGSIFKVKAEFGTEMNRNQEEQWNYARFAAHLTEEEKLRPCDREAVKELIRFGARRSAQKNKLLTRFSEIANLLREADYFATKGNADVIGGAHIRQALSSRIFRSDRIAEKIRELISEGTLLIDIRGRQVGQVNGLAVADLGDYAFGRPARVTATVSLGNQGIINIEREAKLSGSTHDKGMLILSGYLRQKYGQDKPLSLSASLCFEQSYSGIDGDSASSTELYALLSSLSEIPLRQDVAVTGSINQWGQIQAIGGVNEKIEGFFDVCSVVGFTGDQGVCIPASNIRNLILREDVRAAIADKRFHIYPVETVDEGLELLTGFKAGSVQEERTIHWRIASRLRSMAETLHNFGVNHQPQSVLIQQPEIPPHLPPRLPVDNS